MSGDKGSPRLVKFYWVVAAMVGAIIGAGVVSLYGPAVTVWGIAGVGLPIAALVAYLEWSSGEVQRRTTVRPRLEEKRRVPCPQRRRYDYKTPGSRGQLHAISRQKTEPPSSSTS